MINFIVYKTRVLQKYDTLKLFNYKACNLQKNVLPYIVRAIN